MTPQLKDTLRTIGSYILIYIFMGFMFSFSRGVTDDGPRAGFGSGFTVATIIMGIYFIYAFGKAVGREEQKKIMEYRKERLKKELTNTSTL